MPVTKNLDAAQQKLAAMINARRKLEVDIAEPGSQAEAGRSGAGVERISCSTTASWPAQGADQRHPHAARRGRQAGQRRRERRVEIPLDEATPSDITDQVAEYFKLNGEGDVEVAAAVLSKSSCQRVRHGEIRRGELGSGAISRLLIEGICAPTTPSKSPLEQPWPRPRSLKSRKRIAKSECLQRMQVEERHAASLNPTNY